MEAKFVFQGVDYVRLTQGDHRPFGDWEGLLLPEMMEEERAGRRSHFRWLLGYYGRVGEHCFVGRNDTGCMVQVSSALADKLFRPLSHAGGRCSRIDIQVTSQPPEGQDSYLHAAYTMLSLSEKRKGRPQTVQMIDTNYGAKMVTVGSRQSDVYARIYDKHKESKDDNWAGHVRHELEIKNQTARDMHFWLMEDLTRVHTIKSVVGSYFQKRGCPMFWDEYETREMPALKKRNKSDDTKLAWLAVQVAPTLKTLLENGKALEAAHALLTWCPNDVMIGELALLLGQSVHS